MRPLISSSVVAVFGPSGGSLSIWRSSAGFPSGGLNAFARRGIARPA